jgi:tetratricopeptide (TPR) repeat protein
MGRLGIVPRCNRAVLMALALLLIQLAAPTPSRAAVPPATPAALLPVPPVQVAAMEAAVREQVAAAQRSLPTLAAVRGLPPATAAGVFGQAGQVFLRYLLLDAAVPCLENAAALAPDDARWTYYAGVAAQLHGDLDRAAGHLRRATSMRPPPPAALCRLGDVEMLRGDAAAAGRAYTAALAFPGTAPAAHFGLGRIALQAGDARLAVEHFETALAAQPQASAVHAPLAAAYRRLGQLDRAQAQAAAYGNRPIQFDDPLMREVQEGSAGSRSRVVTATLALDAGRFAEAAEGFRQVLAVDPGDVKSWLNLGHAEERLGDAAAAEREYRHALALDAGNARAHLSLGTLLASVSASGAANASAARGEGIAELQEAVRLNPSLLGARFNLAVALAQEGRLAEALAQCDALLAVRPQDREAQGLRDRLRADLAAGAPPPR